MYVAKLHKKRTAYIFHSRNYLTICKITKYEANEIQGMKKHTLYHRKIYNNGHPKLGFQ